VALAVVALLVSGFAAASAAAGAPCVMLTAGSMPCDGDLQDNAPDDQEQAPLVLTCVAKCPAPVLDRVATPMGAFSFVQFLPWAPSQIALIGVGVDPPRYPPRI